MGTYEDGGPSLSASVSSNPGRQSADHGLNSYPSTSSYSQPQTPRKPSKHMSKDDISRGPAVPISQLPLDVHNAKLFQAAPIPPESGTSNISPVERTQAAETQRRLPPTNGVAADLPHASSLPSDSAMDGVSHLNINGTNTRSNSEMGYYADMTESRPSGPSVHHTPSRADRGRPTTPDPPSNQPQNFSTWPRDEQPGKPNISGPKNGAPIRAGYNFGSKEQTPAEPVAPPERERERKTKSTAFWRFGREKPAGPQVPIPGVVPMSRAVFGVTLQESLSVAQKANLPAVLFRCIQYLEAKKAQEEEGIYRLSGSSAVIKSLRERFNIG